MAYMVGWYEGLYNTNTLRNLPWLGNPAARKKLLVVFHTRFGLDPIHYRPGRARAKPPFLWFEVFVMVLKLP